MINNNTEDSNNKDQIRRYVNKVFKNLSLGKKFEEMNLYQKAIKEYDKVLTAINYIEKNSFRIFENNTLTIPVNSKSTENFKNTSQEALALLNSPNKLDNKNINYLYTHDNNHIFNEKVFNLSFIKNQVKTNIDLLITKRKITEFSNSFKKTQTNMLNSSNNIDKCPSILNSINITSFNNYKQTNNNSNNVFHPSNINSNSYNTSNSNNTSKNERDRDRDKASDSNTNNTNTIQENSLSEIIDKKLETESLINILSEILAKVDLISKDLEHKIEIIVKYHNKKEENKITKMVLEEYKESNKDNNNNNNNNNNNYDKTNFINNIEIMNSLSEYKKLISFVDKIKYLKEEVKLIKFELESDNKLFSNYEINFTEYIRKRGKYDRYKKEIIRLEQRLSNKDFKYN